MRNGVRFIKELSRKPTHISGLRDALLGIKSEKIIKKQDIGVLKQSILRLKKPKMLIQ